MSEPLKVLLAEDNPDDTELALIELRRAGFDPDWRRVDTEKAFVAQLDGSVDVILSDYDMGGFTGLRALELLKQSGLEIPFILVSGTIGEDLAVISMKNGATDYLLKDRLVRLGPAVVNARAECKMRQEQGRLAELAQRQQAELRVLFDLMPAMIWFKDAENRILRVNQRVADTAGKSVAEIEGKPSVEIYPHEAARFFADDLKVIRSGVPALGIVESLRDLAGREIWVQTDKVPVFDKDQRVIGIVVMAQDITVRKQAEEALRESEQRFSGAFEHSPIGVSLLSLEGRWLKVNRALCQLLGYTELELLALGFQDVTHPDDLEQSMDYVRRISAGEVQSYEIEKRYIHHSGRTVVAVVNVSAVPDRHGRPAYFVAQFQDVTQRREAEIALAELSRQTARRERLFDTAFSSMSDFAQVYDRNGRLLFANQSLLKLWGRTLESVVGKDFLDLGYPLALAGKLQAQLMEVFERGNVITDETAYVSPAGAQGFYEYIFSPVLADDGSVEFVVESTRDVTERKRAADAAKRSAKLLRDIIDGLGPSMFVALLTPDGVLVEVNNAPLVAANLKPADVLGKHFADTPWWAGPPEVQAQLRAAIQRAAGGEPSRYDVRTHGAGGEIIDVDFSLQPLRNEAGQVVFLVPSASVITERKRVEEKLRGSLDEFRNLAEAMPQMVWVARADGWNTYFSQQWVDYTGLTSEESHGQSWIRPFHPDDISSAQDAWRLAMVTGVYSIEARLRRADGVYRWWLVRGVPQRDSEGEIVKWFGTCTDIHDMKLAELNIIHTNSALQESEARFLQLAASIDQVFWLREAETGRFLYISPIYERIWGCSSLGLFADPGSWYATIHPDDRDRLRRAAIAPNRQAGRDETYRVIRPDGTERWVRDRWFPVFAPDDTIISYAGLAEDITEKRKLESQYLRAQRMEGIGTLAGGIAHDLNNVLAPILMSVELLRQEALSARGMRLLEMMESSAKRGAGMVKQVLTFARGVDGERVQLDPRHIFQEIERIICETFPHSIAIKFNVARDCSQILGDATQLQQILLNLCVNARDAMPSGGTLSVGASNLVIDDHYAAMNPGAQKGAHVVFEVTDSGSGIPQEIINKIFDPFFTTKAIGKGTGLGLSTLQVIVKSHGGFVQVHSETGKGSTFKIFLPAGVQADIGTNRPFVGDLPRGTGDLILVVDDEEAIRCVTQHTLEAFGYRVLVARDGLEAIALFAQNGAEISVVLTDVNMPRMDGPMLIQSIRHIRPDVRFVATSGVVSAGELEQRADSKVLYHLLKPYTAETLLKTVRLALQAPAGETEWKKDSTGRRSGQVLSSPEAGPARGIDPHENKPAA
ncbi:MAG: domain S-box [Verrucomicrobia bacterium]|nr:domain S-box [Verrucomicrobiota bacterium]